jgi:hypothetical protein
MPKGKMPKGKCEYCGQEIAKSTVSKHLATCSERKAVLAKVAEKGGKGEKLYHLRVQDAHLKDFWLDLEMRGSATLNDLDKYLRDIWLECCGHLSQFSFGGWRGEEIAQSRKIEQVLKPDDVLTHIYDFGTSSETLIKALDIRQGNPTTRHPIALMMRNQLREVQCLECDQPAKWFCQECLIEEDKSGLLCDEHAEDHPHDDYGEPVELVNSPRMGMCGYEGPAEPPY